MQLQKLINNKEVSNITSIENTYSDLVKDNSSMNDSKIDVSSSSPSKTNSLSIDANKEKYSCDTCRKYKKKCSKERPACDRCRNKGLEAECFYPGKSRRRTKAEMNIAKGKDSTSNNIDINDSLNGGVKKPLRNKNRTQSIDNKLKKEEVILLTTESKKIRNEERKEEARNNSSRSNSYTPLSTINNGIKSFSYQNTTFPFQQPNSANSLSSIIKAARSPPVISPHQNSLNFLKSPPNFGIKNNMKLINSYSQTINPVISTETNNNNNNSSSNSGSNSNSIPIAAANIQYETIASIFKGGQPNPIKQYTITKPFVIKAISAYFLHNHRIYPMIDKLKFNERVSQIGDNFAELEAIAENDDENEIFKFMLYFMLAIGATTLQRAGNLEDSLVGIDEYLAFLAMKRFKIVMKYQKLDTIRCLILLGVYSFFEPKGISSWTIGGVICRLCIGLGLNKQLVGKKKLRFNEVELELRNRCYWSTYCFEKLVHLSLLRGDGGLDVNDSDIPLPKALFPEEEDDMKVNNMMINLRVLENKIFQSLHTIKAGNKYKDATMEKRLQLINQLQTELDETFQKYKAEFKSYNSYLSNPNCVSSSASSACGDVSFHRSELWLVMRYEQFQILLYRPSKVLPRLPMDILTKLGTVCLSSLRHSYMLYQQKKMPYNWVTLFRALNVCNATCVCLYNWSINLNDCERDFKQIIEVLSNFGPKWHAAKTFAKVFENISQSLLQFSLHVNENNEEELQQLNYDLFGPNSEYYDIMDENDVDISWLDFIKE
ncbi:hypothetical protein HANVADRAFT_51974 [Hanseniaspora valbyensis NRRL Y-1626]|uniref:Zn(2)-C6 fungal-type domain-containing protein n=1 Tax=Hanseniaspora valbyensis NRRL Y-1626 TaxID=766949 RepID=A0A1B7TGK7_9ASCO|nr:hypothetical protein HANVADRAFT_51974 [Hanseniaspora valbyensis NRRL Y-1626]